jgi:hypothetical protein
LFDASVVPHAGSPAGATDNVEPRGIAYGTTTVDGVDRSGWTTTCDFSAGGLLTTHPARTSPTIASNAREKAFIVSAPSLINWMESAG